MATQTNITISKQDAQQILELFDSIEMADKHYYSCQSNVFRRFVVSTSKSANVSGAYARLKAKLEPDKGE